MLSGVASNSLRYRTSPSRPSSAIAAAFREAHGRDVCVQVVVRPREEGAARPDTKREATAPAARATPRPAAGPFAPIPLTLRDTESDLGLATISAKGGSLTLQLSGVAALSITVAVIQISE